MAENDDKSQSVYGGLIDERGPSHLFIRPLNEGRRPAAAGRSKRIPRSASEKRSANIFCALWCSIIPVFGVFIKTAFNRRNGDGWGITTTMRVNLCICRFCAAVQERDVSRANGCSSSFFEIDDCRLFFRIDRIRIRPHVTDSIKTLRKNPSIDWNDNNYLNEATIGDTFLKKKKTLCDLHVQIWIDSSIVNNQRIFTIQSICMDSYFFYFYFLGYFFILKEITARMNGSKRSTERMNYF